MSDASTLKFNTYRQGCCWCVNIYIEDYPYKDATGGCPQMKLRLTEEQYCAIAAWCKQTFEQDRVRRTGYSTFWFKSKKDLDWFMLRWAAVDSSAI